jgi:hypothetical protein
MKSTLEDLSASEKNALALFYDSAAYKALRHLCQAEIEGLGKDALLSQSHEHTRWLGGQADMAAKILKIIRELYKESQKG